MVLSVWEIYAEKILYRSFILTKMRKVKNKKLKKLLILYCCLLFSKLKNGKLENEIWISTHTCKHPLDGSFNLMFVDHDKDGHEQYNPKKEHM